MYTQAHIAHSQTMLFPRPNPLLLSKMNYSVNIPRGCFFSFFLPFLFFFLLELITCATETEKVKSELYENIVI